MRRSRGQIPRARFDIWRASHLWRRPFGGWIPMPRELKIGLGALLLAGTLIYVSSLLGIIRERAKHRARRKPPLPATCVHGRCHEMSVAGRIRSPALRNFYRNLPAILPTTVTPAMATMAVVPRKWEATFSPARPTCGSTLRRSLATASSTTSFTTASAGSPR